MNAKPTVAGPSFTPHVAGADPSRILAATKGPKPLSSFASSKLRWNTLNGSGPVSNTQFLRAHAMDNIHSHDWVFGRGK